MEMLLHSMQYGEFVVIAQLKHQATPPQPARKMVTQAIQYVLNVAW